MVLKQWLGLALGVTLLILAGAFCAGMVVRL